MNPSLPEGRRRRVLQLVAGAAVGAKWPGAGATALAAPPRVAFMTREAGAAALTQMPGDRYYAIMGRLEIAARTHAPMASASLADARAAVARYEADAVLPFTDDECAAIRGVIERMQPLLAERAPLYARTPWSFIKLDDRAEGGLPHTRGPHIVLPRSGAEFLAARHRQMAEAGTLGASPHGAPC